MLFTQLFCSYGESTLHTCSLAHSKLSDTSHPGSSQHSAFSSKEIKAGVVSLDINPGEVPGLIPVIGHETDQRVVVPLSFVETACRCIELWWVGEAGRGP